MVFSATFPNAFWSRANFSPHWSTRARHPSSDVSHVKINDLKQKAEQGAAGWVFLWLIGVPVPLLLLFFLLRGCT